jgi:hypothetical protein
MAIYITLILHIIKLTNKTKLTSISINVYINSLLILFIPSIIVSFNRLKCSSNYMNVYEYVSSDTDTIHNTWLRQLLQDGLLIYPLAYITIILGIYVYSFY